MADVFRSLERLMSMDDRVWRRHANPWSGWTRVTALPLLVLAIWSRVWIGWWAMLAVLAVLAWIWLNPRLFPEPRTLDAWMTRGRAGRAHLPGAPGGRRGGACAGGQTPELAVAAGARVMVWGLWALWWEGAVFGMILALLPKLWFLDRMVWVHRDWVARGPAVPGYEDERMEGGMPETIDHGGRRAAWRGWC
jgi:hypothetical protein